MLIKKNRTDEEKLYWRAERGNSENDPSFDNFTRKISFGFLIRINSIISSENFQKKNFTRDPNSDFGVIISFWISSEILQN